MLIPRLMFGGFINLDSLTLILVLECIISIYSWLGKNGVPARGTYSFGEREGKEKKNLSISARHVELCGARGSYDPWPEDLL